MPDIEIKFKNKTYNVGVRDEADKSVLAEIFRYREYRAVDGIIGRAADPILDVGAHAGFFSLYARALNPKVKIFALEPEKKNLLALNKNFKINKIKNVKILPVALAGISGERKIMLSADTHNHHLSALDDEFFYDCANHNHADQHPASIKIKAVSCADICVKNKIKKLSLVKMDIEGGEYEIISSLLPSDYARIACIIIEYHDFDGFKHGGIEDELRENGFGVQVFPSKFDKKMGFLLARNKRI